jgi:hypothetical protein
MNGEQLMILSFSPRSLPSLLATSLSMNMTPAMSTKMILLGVSRWRAQVASNSAYEVEVTVPSSRSLITFPFSAFSVIRNISLSAPLHLL